MGSAAPLCPSGAGGGYGDGQPVGFLGACGRRLIAAKIVAGQSGRLACGYLYADAGMGESTQDLVFAGHNLICENGSVLCESERFTTGLLSSELDLGRLSYERRRMNTFGQTQNQMTDIWFDLPLYEVSQLTRRFAQLPFVPSDKTELAEHCEEILQIQAAGLASTSAPYPCKNGSDWAFGV